VRWEDGETARSHQGTEIAEQEETRVGQVMTVHKMNRQRVQYPRVKKAT
jgi:hypothetical protein